MWVICGFPVCSSVTRVCWGIVNAHTIGKAQHEDNEFQKYPEKKFSSLSAAFMFYRRPINPQFMVSEQIPPSQPNLTQCGFTFLPPNRQFAQDYTILFAWLYNLLFSNIPLKSKQHNRKNSRVSQLFQNPVSGMCKGYKIKKIFFFFGFVTRFLIQTFPGRTNIYIYIYI